MMPKKLLVTGGAGFIGTNFIYHWLRHYPDDQITNLDALTYAGNRSNLTQLDDNANYRFIEGNICDAQLVDQLMQGVDVVVHFAAETHVDRSILEPGVFLQTNVLGTYILLEAAVKHKIGRFHHISTDEVFGSLPLDGDLKFDENTPYDPRSPYSASKAASDHLVRAYSETFGLPISITNCSNNYGEYHFPEKLVPLAITNLIDGQPIPIYGNGLQIRDWLFVQDHCLAIEKVLLSELKNETFVIGGFSDKEQITNLDLARLILKQMNMPDDMISFVKDRSGHDQRYSVNSEKIRRNLGWRPTVSLEEGLQRTIEWYKNNESWWRPLKARAADFFNKNYQKVE
jgi:dTDP-glucose 4,6-dehydratase